MSRLDWEKAGRVRAWRDSERSAWSGHVPPAVLKASEKQIGYMQALLRRAGRRELTAVEVAALTMDGASRLIKEFKK